MWLVLMIFIVNITLLGLYGKSYTDNMGTANTTIVNPFST